jgi:hypothetical protein
MNVLTVLSIFNILVKTLEGLYSSTKKAYTALIDSQTPDAWVFVNRNSIPWITKSPFGFTFYPDTNKFYIESNVKHSFDDVVTVEILDSDNILVKDVTEFFHNTRWGSMSPTLYEMALVFFLTNNMIVPDTVLCTYSFQCLTLDSGVITIALNSEKAKQPFMNWL